MFKKSKPLDQQALDAVPDLAKRCRSNRMRIHNHWLKVKTLSELRYRRYCSPFTVQWSTLIRITGSNNDRKFLQIFLKALVLSSNKSRTADILLCEFSSGSVYEWGGQSHRPTTVGYVQWSPTGNVPVLHSCTVKLGNVVTCFWTKQFLSQNRCCHFNVWLLPTSRFY